MTIAKADPATLCNAFPLTLTGSAQIWYGRLEAESIKDFEALCEAFVLQFLGSRIQQGWSYLKTIKQGESESLRSYLARFDAAVLECPGVTQETILNAAQEGTTQGRVARVGSRTKIHTNRYHP